MTVGCSGCDLEGGHGPDCPVKKIKRATPCNSELAANLRRIFTKMHRELEPGNDSHSAMIDLVNHADAIAQQIEG